MNETAQRPGMPRCASVYNVTRAAGNNVVHPAASFNERRAALVEAEKAELPNGNLVCGGSCCCKFKALLPGHGLTHLGNF